MTSFFNRFSRKKAKEQVNPPDQNEDPVDFTRSDTNQDPGSDEVSEQAQSVNPRFDILQLIVGIGQSNGVERDTNEDSVFTLTTNIITNADNLQFGLYIIADGMGGYESGEVASRLAVEYLTTHVIEDFYLPLITSNVSKSGLSIQEIMESGIEAAHHAIKSHTKGGGSTLTAALILGNHVTIAHVGDSRAYLVSPLGDVQLITTDHSLVKRLTEIGQISPEEAINHPQRNILYKALGQGDQFEANISSFQLIPGSTLVLCTDGLWGVLPENELMDWFRSPNAPSHICQTLVNLANKLGGPDNITVVIIRIPGGK